MAVRKYSFTIKGHRTSISLEEAFYAALCEMAHLRGEPVASLIAEIDAARRDDAMAKAASGSADVYSGLSSAIRVHILQAYRKRLGLDPL